MTKELGQTPDGLRLQVVKLRTEGKTIGEIAELLNKNVRTIARVCRENFLGQKAGRPQKASDIEIERIHRQLIANAISWKDAANKVGLSVSQLRRRIAKLKKSEADKYLERLTGRIT
jgi:AraC-like DNA-binding protein